MDVTPRPLHVLGVSNFSLFFTKCPCGHLTVHGCWHQLLKVTDPQKKLVKAVTRCEACNKARVRRFRLTTGRPFRRRLVRWDTLFWAVVLYLPRGWVRPAARASVWLERWFPL